MYANMAMAGARLDPMAAATMISLYRKNNGLSTVEVDPELVRLAETQSQAMANQNKLDRILANQARILANQKKILAKRRG